MPSIGKTPLFVPVSTAPRTTRLELSIAASWMRRQEIMGRRRIEIEPGPWAELLERAALALHPVSTADAA